VGLRRLFTKVEDLRPGGGGVGGPELAVQPGVEIVQVIAAVAAAPAAATAAAAPAPAAAGADVRLG